MSMSMNMDAPNEAASEQRRRRVYQRRIEEESDEIQNSLKRLKWLACQDNHVGALCELSDIRQRIEQLEGLIRQEMNK